LIDNVLGIGKLDNGAQISLSWNKISLGKRNGLALKIYGEKAAISWEQENPEYLSYTGKDGITKILDRSNSAMHVAAAPRYQRFKPGHPAGYIEAFANLYLDIATDLTTYKNRAEKKVVEASNSTYTHNALNSYEGLRVLETLHESAMIGKTLPIKR
jgi:predicted dehydrogenase